ncbi:MAG: hypothetical protein MUF54_23920 [Polyangiaceae bacterium]|nr:hypothetical protein [Polyangiaceae bacterium]
MKIIGRTWIACLLLAVVGCSGSCDKDKPYVPYSIDPSAITSPQGSAASSTAADEPPAPEAMRQRFKAVDAQRFKEHPKTASSSLGELRAPEGMRIELVLERDIDGDSKQDVVAWLRSDDGSRGELVRFGAARQGGPIRATTLAPLPADMTASTGCDPAAALQQVGPRTVVVSFTRACGRGATAPSAMRWIAAVVPTRNPAERLSMLVVEPTGPSELRISMDGLDRDGDGFDDLLVNVSVEEPGVVDGSVAASLYYFDRPAGLSRDPHEPSASLAAAAKRIAREAQRKEALAKVQSMGRRLRRLYQTLCAEGGAATIRVAGAALQCGARDSVLAAAEAEIDAALRADAWAWAFGVQQRIAQIGGNHDTVARTRGRLEAVVQRVDADTYHLPFKPGTEPRVGVGWGGLAFDDSGALRIRTSTALLTGCARRASRGVGHEGHGPGRKQAAVAPGEPVRRGPGAGGVRRSGGERA